MKYSRLLVFADLSLVYIRTTFLSIVRIDSRKILLWQKCCLMRESYQPGASSKCKRLEGSEAMMSKQSRRELLAVVLHCLTKNLTLRSTRTTPSGIIVACSTIPPLHQF